MNYINSHSFKKKCVVVIPVHNADPSYYELISFKQCYEILHAYPIYVVAPAGMDLTRYHRLVRDIKIISVNTKWLSSLLYYNKLKLSHFFYQFFDDYTYLLTYELDAFIFKDDLEYWCSKEYDYIGAPWFRNNEPAENKILITGNSGFSLRKISSIKAGIKYVYLIDPAKLEQIKQKAVSLKRLDQLKRCKPAILKIIGILSYFRYLFEAENSSIQNADFLFAEDDVIINQMSNIKDLKIAPVTEAYKFSFEVGPQVLFNMNSHVLPTGCHAWWRYDLDFWKPYIQKFGYKL